MNDYVRQYSGQLSGNFPQKQGKIFGAVAAEMFCKAVNDPEWIFFEVPVRAKKEQGGSLKVGDATGDGFNCKQPDLIGFILQAGGNIPRPDFVVGDYLPHEDQIEGTGGRNILIGDFGRSTTTFVRKYIGLTPYPAGSPNQAKAMIAYSLRHGYQIVALVSLFKVSKRGEDFNQNVAKLVPFFLKEKVFPIIVSIF